MQMNIAVIGQAGVGKSSFINALRGLKPKEPGAAEVSSGARSCTKGTKIYSHPNNTNLVFSDLPGVGTQDYLKCDYLKEVSVDKYDFFLLLSAGRFTETDIWLGEEITKRKKRFMFVRTKIDIVVEQSKFDDGATEEQTVAAEREQICGQIKEAGCSAKGVYLITNRGKTKYDFPQLEIDLANNFPEEKRESFLLSIDATSEKLIASKMKLLHGLAYTAAISSAGVAIVPIPGISIAFDVGLVLSHTIFSMQRLGLDNESIGRYCRSNNSEAIAMKNIIDQALGFQVSRAGIVALAVSMTGLMVAETVEEFCRFIPIIGALIAAPISFSTTLYLIKYILGKLELAVLEVLRYTMKKGIA